MEYGTHRQANQEHQPTGKKQTFADGGGLSLIVAATGGKYWQYNFRHNGKQKSLRLGTYPDVSLSQAREQHIQARKQLAAGQDPAAAKQQAKQERQAALLNTFEHIAREWHGKQLHRWKPNHASRIMYYLENDVFPHIGNKPIFELGVKDIKAVTERIIERGAIETADKIRQWIGAIFDYATLLELVNGNPAAPLRKIMPKREAKHMAALPREELQEFYRRLLLADVKQQNRLAVMLIMLVFVRNTELRGGEWAEIDWQAKTWTIPAHRMKRPRLHVIPLSDWALELLQTLHGLTGDGRHMFPSRTAADGYISENTLGKIINNMGYKDTATPHGFRSLASSTLNEQGFNRDAIERQLAHIEDNKIRAAYNRADYMDERRDMMQWYSDFLKQHYEAAQANKAV